ncbi:hypothetical protein [Lysobacter gummosus]|uniref:hypothetical protein n=1 Tax=Lysobacter gummosus TaxID=262324 RepID=UPI003640B65F
MLRRSAAHDPAHAPAARSHRQRPDLAARARPSGRAPARGRHPRRARAQRHPHRAAPSVRR